MIWRNRVRDTLKKYMSDGAAEAGTALLNSFYCAERVAAGRMDEQVKGSVTSMLVDLTFALPDNPWWRQHGMTVGSVHRVAVCAWLDAMAYFTQGKEKEAYAVSCRAVVMEVAQACLLADKGFVEAKKVSRQLRDELAAIPLE